MNTTSYHAEMRIDLHYGTFDEREHCAAVLRKALGAAAKAFVETANVEGGYPYTSAEVRVHHADSDVYQGEEGVATPTRGPVAVTLSVGGHIYVPTKPPTPEVKES